MLEIMISRNLQDPLLKPSQRIECLDQYEPGCWINLTTPTEDEIRQVEQMVNVPPEFMRYPLDEEERPRIDYDDETNAILIIADLPYFDTEGTQTKYITMPLGILLVDKCLITISLRDASILDPFRSGRVKEFFTQYHTRFCLQILLSGAKEFLKLLRFMDKTIDQAEKQLSKSISNKELYRLMQLGKSLIYFSTSLKSNQSVLERMTRYRQVKKYEEDTDLLEDVLIEYSQALEMANIYASIINGTMDAYASIISNNLNVVMKFMAAMSIVLAVPTLITGFFGQNFPFPHDSEFVAQSWPFIGSLLMCTVAVFITIWLLRKRDMF